MWERINEGLELLDLSGWLSDYAEYKEDGQEIRLKDCPECGNDNYKLYVNPDKKCWICFVCDWGRGSGDVCKLMAGVSGRDVWDIRREMQATVPLAPAGDLATLLKAKMDGTESVDKEPTPEIEIPGAADFSGLTTQRLYHYALLTRGLTPEDVRDLDLRAAAKLPGRRGDISGPFLVFPVRKGGKNVAWQGRRLGDRDPKYVSHTAIKQWVWPLDEMFFKVYDSKQLFLVEGVFDALGMLKMGLPAVCTFGKSISDAQIAILRKLKPTEIVFAWDLDAAPQIIKAVTRVSYHFPNTSIVSFDGSGKKVDPGDTMTSAEDRAWVLSKIGEKLDTRSKEYFQWQILNQ